MVSFISFSFELASVEKFGVGFPWALASLVFFPIFFHSSRKMVGVDAGGVVWKYRRKICEYAVKTCRNSNQLKPPSLLYCIYLDGIGITYPAEMTRGRKIVYMLD